ncbi:MAG: tRNA pseudouridine(55) synthase TruB [Bacteroidetes bacterium]|nr:tRNA pseudouridine(55) synthase TruB [Bacteroidota bacterium]
MDQSTDRIILINKPYRWTSFDVVKKLRKPLLEEKRLTLPESERKIFKNYKVGHAGTLDPLATGLLILCTGKLTKKISEIQDAEKEYTGSICIGSTTASFDLESVPENHKDIGHISEEIIRSTAMSFMGRQQQTPPAHSAVKIDGQRAYEKARKGQEFEIKSKEIEIRAFEITAIRLPEIDFRVVCTKGTYIRSLADDFGKKLGVGAHLSALCRTRIGDFSLNDAISPLDFLAQLTDKQQV